ncbi:MAG: transposase [Sphingobacteriales bacterium]|nr:transposase [Sphingobacteriales bacterium]
MIDKFHVIKHLLDALQQVRKQLKTQYINQETILVKAIRMNNKHTGAILNYWSAAAIFFSKCKMNGRKMN